VLGGGKEGGREVCWGRGGQCRLAKRPKTRRQIRRFVNVVEAQDVGGRGEAKTPGKIEVASLTQGIITRAT